MWTRKFEKEENINFGEKAPTSSTNIEDASTAYNQGYVSFHNNDFINAIRFYKKAIELDPKYVDAYDNCGLCYRRVEKLDSAIYCYKKSIDILPSSMIPHQNLAVVYHIQSKFDSSLNEYLEIRKYNPNSPDAYYGIADAYFSLNQPEKALPNALKSLELFKKYNPQYVGDAAYAVGLGYYKTGDKANAKKYMQLSANAGNDVPYIYKSELDIK